MAAVCLPFSAATDQKEMMKRLENEVIRGLVSTVVACRRKFISGGHRSRTDAVFTVTRIANFQLGPTKRKSRESGLPATIPVERKTSTPQ
jgi:hypothetical protein